jgi:sugar/nucleoside kinase (ribokinase family)
MRNVTLGPIRGNHPPSVLGAGLIALDLVFEGSRAGEPSPWAGGTCGNVLAILSYFGWRAMPVARLNGDEASRRIEHDLRAWGVDLRFARLEPAAPAPIIVQRIHRTASGQVSHRFSLCCPRCGGWFPSFRPVPLKPLDPVVAEMPSPQVFFTDRASPGALRLARAARERGAVVAFEPSGVGDPRHLREMLELTHVLKYSRERLPSVGGVPASNGVKLEVQTLGAAGMRFRSRLRGFRTREWQHMPAFEVPELRDAAGSGDWCTAGILHGLARGGHTGFERISRADVLKAVQFGQALASWNCRFVGARGGMYVTTADECYKSAQAITRGAATRSAYPERVDAATAKLLQSICGTCQST